MARSSASCRAAAVSTSSPPSAAYGSAPGPVGGLMKPAWNHAVNTRVAARCSAATVVLPLATASAP